ncbi:MAG: hypothetical protein VX560_01850, partial [SAR324 cluster bacterium]|nr:hypothetical protein [SAR324 cluster bacterium]
LIGNEDLNLFSGSTRTPMNASETLLREILREMQKQTEILKRIDHNLPQMNDLDSSEAERRKNFRQDLDQLRETLQKQKQEVRIESISANDPES